MTADEIRKMSSVLALFGFKPGLMITTCTHCDRGFYGSPTSRVCRWCALLAWEKFKKENRDGNTEGPKVDGVQQAAACEPDCAGDHVTPQDRND